MNSRDDSICFALDGVNGIYPKTPLLIFTIRSTCIHYILRHQHPFASVYYE